MHTYCLLFYSTVCLSLVGHGLELELAGGVSGAEEQVTERGDQPNHKSEDNRVPRSGNRWYGKKTKQTASTFILESL